MIRRERSMPVYHPPLADTLRLMMPCASTTLLLRAALLRDGAAGDAWSQWRRSVEDPKAFLAADTVGIKRHLPLLYRNLTMQGVGVGRDLEPYFRAARAREELRSTRFRRFLGEALSALRRAEIEFLVGKGVTVGETVHCDPVLRHSHDIDLLVQTQSLPAAAAALEAAGFAPSENTAAGEEPRFDHESGLPVELHDRLYCTPFYDGDLAGPRARARPVEILGMPVLRISDEDLLVHAPVHASLVPQRRGLSWIIDVVSLLQTRADSGVAIDWQKVLQIARDARATLPLYVMYHYLVETFDAPIPREVIDDLGRAAMGINTAQRLAALDGLRSELQTSGIRTLMAASGWRSRMAMARALLFPPPSYLKARYPGLNHLSLAMAYTARPLRFVARQFRRIEYRLRRRWLGPGTNGSQPVMVAGSADSTPPPAREATATAGRSSP